MTFFQDDKFSKMNKKWQLLFNPELWFLMQFELNQHLITNMVKYCVLAQNSACEVEVSILDNKGKSAHFERKHSIEWINLFLLMWKIASFISVLECPRLDKKHPIRNLSYVLMVLVDRERY